jgi:hypothetical protein
LELTNNRELTSWLIIASSGYVTTVGGKVLKSPIMYITHIAYIVNVMNMVKRFMNAAIVEEQNPKAEWRPEPCVRLAGKLMLHSSDKVARKRT